MSLPLRGGATQSPLRIRLLGAFAVERDGMRIGAEAIGRRRARDLLQLLALAPGHRLSRERIIDALWPDKDPEAGANNLHRALHDLRQIIGRGHVFAGKGLVRLGDGVRVDVAEFESLAASKDLEQTAKALALYTGDLAADDGLSSEVAARREQLRHRFADLALRAAQQMASHDHRAAIDLLRRVVAVDRTNEEAHRLLMRKLAAAGRRGEALRQYEECERALREEFDASPAPQTRQLFESLSREESVTPAPQSAGWERVARRLLGTPSPPAIRGRSDALRLIAEFATSRAGVLLLVGEAGIGKTHAAVECARVACGAGAVVLSGTALEFERALPYAPFVDAWADGLRARGLGPEENPFLSFSAAPGGNPQEDKLRLFQSVQASLETLAGGRTIVLVIDDLHFADESTLHLFHFLARATRTAPILLVGTCREEEIGVNPPLHALVSGIYRERLGKRLVLNRLDREATRQLVDDLLGGRADDALLDSIYGLTEGNPFFVEEVVHSIEDRRRPLAVPADLASVVIERVARLGPDVGQLLTAAAVLGQTFDFELARHVAGCEGDAVEALERSLAARLIEEDENRYRFRHGLVREALYQKISRPRRSELHRLAGEAIERSDPERVEEIALHLRAAGDLRRALPYLLQAARRAATRLGLGEAVAFYQQALAAMDDLNVPPGEERFKVLLRLGQINFSLSNLDAAVSQLDEAASLRRLADGWRPAAPDRARARRCAALALITAGNLVEADRRLDEALRDLEGEETSGEYPHVLYHLAQLRWHEGNHQEAYAVAERCLREAERHGDPQLIAKGYEILSLSCHSLGEWKSGMEFEERRRALVGSTVDVAQAFDVHL